jgi:hypothetical protein
MKKPIIVSVITAVTLLSWGSFATAQPQDAPKEEKPTFYRLIPGVYVNGWPRFTIHYPKDWIERMGDFTETFRAEPPGRTGEMFVITITQSSQPLDEEADRLVRALKNIAKDVTVVSDKPSQLQDGTPAREVEARMVINGIPSSLLVLSTKKGDAWITTGVGGRNVRIGEDLKAILYSLQYEPGKDEPVKAPADVQEFLDRWRNDIVAHDVAKFVSHYSDRFLNSGMNKGGVERLWRQLIGPITSVEVVLTDFIGTEDRA